jgi:hypothetical protein
MSLFVGNVSVDGKAVLRPRQVATDVQMAKLPKLLQLQY